MPYKNKERQKEAQRKWELSNAERRKGDRHKPTEKRHASKKESASKSMRKGREIEASERPFLPRIEGIDGETQNGKYVLLASSKRPPLYKKEGIYATDFLEYLLEAPPGTIQVGYVFRYDIIKLMSGMTDKQRRILIKKKWLTYKRFDKPNILIQVEHSSPRRLRVWEFEWPGTIREFWDDKKLGKHRTAKVLRKAVLYSIEHFSSTGAFLDTMKGWGLLERGSDAEKFMIAMKNLRGWSLWDDAPRDILEEYNAMECYMIEQWCEQIITFYSFLGIRLDGSRYSPLNGYGSAAKKLLKKYNAKIHFQENGIFTVDQLSRLYIAGRSELFRRGEFKNVYYYDLKNAYVTAISQIPSLSPQEVRWETMTYPSPGNLEYFGVSKVSWKPRFK